MVENFLRLCVVCLVCLTVSCGGGGGGGGEGNQVATPSNLVYSQNPAVYTVGIPIATNVPTTSGGPVESFEVSPALPPGLSLNTASGEITGTPSATSAAANYTVTARNTSGSTATALAITVNAVAATPSVSLIGAVSGTILVAIDADGNFLASDSTAGKAPNLDLDDDGEVESHSFVLSNIPLERPFRVFLITGGRIHPMYIEGSNKFSAASETTIDLGFVDVESSLDGRAIAGKRPDLASGLRSVGTDATIPVALGSPPTDDLSTPQLLDEAISALQSGWLPGARTYLQAAVARATGSSTGDVDAARFLLAVTTVLAWAADTPSDGNAADLNRLGDLLDQLNLPNDERRGHGQLISSDVPLPAGSPTSGDGQRFLHNVTAASIDASISQLSAISEAFQRRWIDPFGSGRAIETDYGDVLVLRGILNGIAAVLDVQGAYNLDADIDASLADDALTVSSFLLQHPNFLRVAQPARLASARTRILAAVTDLRQAIQRIGIEPDAQSDDLITLDSSSSDQSVAYLNEIQAALTSGSYTTSGTSPATLDLSRIFGQGVDFRSPAPGLIPPIDDNTVVGLFPDPSFNSTVSGSFDVNEDIAPADGVPDILQ